VVSERLRQEISRLERAASRGQEKYFDPPLEVGEHASRQIQRHYDMCHSGEDSRV
jgi:hypothetical protein